MSGELPAADPDALLALAVEAAREAGGLLLERFRSGEAAGVRSKTTPTELVSEADEEAERAIETLLAGRRPDDGLLGEEGGETRPTRSGLRWVVDPLDGTINFLFGIPQWCVSVAVEDGEGTLAGAILDPARGELFTAVRGGVPLLDGEPLRRPVRQGGLREAMVVTGFAYDARVRAAQAPVLARLIPLVRDVRRMGSAALDLAWTAAGRYDAYFERTVKPWDIAAGELVCRTAGLAVRELPDAPDLPWGILAAAPGLADELLPLVAGAA